MAVLFLPSSALARETVTFDFAANPWGYTLGSGSGATAEAGNVTAPIERDGVSMSFDQGEATAPARMWTGPQLRVYANSTFTFTAPTGKVIEKIEFTGSTVTISTEIGAYDSSIKTWTQPAEQVSAVTFKVIDGSKTNKITKAVLTIANPGEAPEVVVLPTAENIAAFKALATDTEAELTLTDAKVLYVSGSEMIVEDATGAIDFYNIGLTATAGQVLNGTIAGKNSLYNGLPQLAKSSNTDVASVTVSDGDAPVAVEMTVADAMAETSYLKYVKLTDATLVLDGTTYYLVNGDNKIQIYNKFKLDYTLPEAIKSIAGIIIPYKKGSADLVVEIAPIAVEDIVAVEPIPEGDITSLILPNPGFEECEANTSDLPTAKNAGVDYTAQGWTITASGDWCNAAVYEYGSTAKLNTVTTPAVDNAGNPGKAMGVTVTWSSNIKYTSASPITFPAGSYTVKINGYNAFSTATLFHSNFAVVAEDKTTVIASSSKSNFASNVWEEDVLTFTLDAETTGYIVFGGYADGAGTAAHAKVFFDNITIERYADALSRDVALLNAEIAKAQKVAAAGLAPTTDLAAAISTAQGVATAGTDSETVLAAIETLKAAVAAYNALNTHFVALADFKAFVAETYKYASEESKTNYNTLAAKTPANAEEADANLAELQLATRAIAESHAKAEGVVDATDKTSLITNPNAEAMDGWTTVKGSGSGGSLGVKSDEPFTDAAGGTDHPYFDGGDWNAKAWDVTLQQTVSLPKGKYMLSATSRASTGMASFALFAGEARTEMAHVGNSGGIFNRGYNLSSVEFEVTEETADVNIGVQGVAAVQYQWMSFTRFQLVKLDKSEAVDPEPEPQPEPVVADGTYYIKNVATGKYLAGGSWWGTHAVVTDYGLDFNVALADGKYTLDSNVAEKATKNYLNGEYIDGYSFGWTLIAAKTSADADAVIISNGGNNLTAQEGGLVTLDTSVEDNAKWVFVSVDEFNAALMAELATATEEDGKDATMLVKAQNFGRNDLRNSAWEGAPGIGGAGNDANANSNAQQFNCTYDVNQTLTVPNGKYTVEIQGFYRNGDIAPAAAAHVGDTEQLLATLYANSAETQLPSIFSGAGTIEEGSTADGIEGQFPNNQTQAGHFFNAGAYNVVLENVIVVDGKLKIGVKKSEAVANDWTCFDNVRLTYYGEIQDLTIYKEAYEAALAAAQAALADEANAVVTGVERTALEAAITANTTVEETKDAYVAATTALNEAAATFKAATAAYQTLEDARVAYAFDANAYPYASSTKLAVLNEALAATPGYADEAKVMTNAIVVAARDYVESNAVAEEQGAVDFTGDIVNPNAENGTEGWTVSLGEGSGGKIGVLNGEPFTDAAGSSTHSYFDGGNWDANAWDVSVSQEVTLPSGEYLLTVTSRASSDMASFQLFANDESVKMKHVGNVGELFDRGWNDCFLVFNVHEDNTPVAIGVQGVADVLHQWMSFTRFRLVRLGDANIINGIQTENLDNATIYSVNGQVVRTNATTTKGLAKGIYVVNGKKVVVK